MSETASPIPRGRPPSARPADGLGARLRGVLARADQTYACRICAAAYRPFFSFGRMPIANGFLRPDQFDGEYFFDLAIGHCTGCGMVQLAEQPEPQRMFHEQYAFFSSTSSRMQTHFAAFADDVRRRYVHAQDPFVVEIGSNDGVLLRNIASAGIRHLGVEPSGNVAEAARKQGVQTQVAFFSEALARDIVAKHGRADVILAANVMCHIPDLPDVIRGVEVLLKDDGVLIFEDPYWVDVLEKTAFDQIYDEHVFYFSVASLTRLFQPHGMEIIEVEPQAVHGGSMRYVVARAGARTVAPSVPEARRKEERLGVHRPESYERLAAGIQRCREELRSLLQDLQRRGHRVVGYGATSKSTTVTNFCGLTPDLVEFISDTTPIKQGKFSPGVHIPVKPYQDFAARPPDYALLFAWNHAEEIFAKERAFEAGGGRWIEYVPRVRVRP